MLKGRGSESSNPIALHRNSVAIFSPNRCEPKAVVERLTCMAANMAPSDQRHGMAELLKFDELRSKTDKELVQIISNALELGIGHARQALKFADTWDVAGRCCLRAKTSYVQASRLLPLVVEITAEERSRLGSRLEHLKGMLDSLSAIGSTPTPTEDEIAVLARALWEAKGRPDGLPDHDWFLAERALKSQVACVGS
jgi:hypothetical protein